MTRRDLLGALCLATRRNNLDEAARLIAQRAASGYLGAAVLAVRTGKADFVRAFGKATGSDAVFLLASITKPMTVAGLMLLADRRELSIDDTVARFIPEFKGDDRARVLVRHLLTHTSGLPDMLPENVELRRRHAPLAEFVQGTCRTPLLFPPGTQVRYQSMGLLLAAEIVHRITRRPFADYLGTELFRPLGLSQTSLGLGGRPLAQTMKCQVDQVSDWDWNSPYWRNLASPWGGAHSTATDIVTLLQYFATHDRGPLKPSTAIAMTTEQTRGLKPRWGFGWTLNDGKFGRGSSPAAFGHGGSTGTLCWHDPAKNLTFVLLTTKPAEHSNDTVLYPAADLVSTSA
jgi:CubicO group peptidase (beta-lactamase class C family)